jgi:hypothetical protein
VGRYPMERLRGADELPIQKWGIASPQRAPADADHATRMTKTNRTRKKTVGTTKKSSLRMIREECAPGLRGRRFPTTDHVLRDRRFRKLESELQKLPVNAWRATARVGHAHLANQIDDLSRHGRPALGMTTLPAPVQPESSPMPGNHCFGLDYHKGRSPTIPELREPSPKIRSAAPSCTLWERFER